MSGKKSKKRSYALVDNLDLDSVELRPNQSAPKRRDRQLNHDPGRHGDILPSISPYYSAYQPPWSSNSAAAYPYAQSPDPNFFPSYQSDEQQQQPLAEEYSYPDPALNEGQNHGQRLVDLAGRALSYPEISSPEDYDHQQTSYDDGHNPNQQSSQFIDGAGSHFPHGYRAVALDSVSPPVSQPPESYFITLSKRAKRMVDRLDAVNGVIIPSKLAPGEEPKKRISKASADTPLYLFCPLCKSGFARKDHMRSHFPGCVGRNGNPNGLRWDQDLPSPQWGPRVAYQSTSRQQEEGTKVWEEGTKVWEEAWKSSWRGQQRSRSQSPWGHFE